MKKNFFFFFFCCCAKVVAHIYILYFFFLLLFTIPLWLTIFTSIPSMHSQFIPSLFNLRGRAAPLHLNIFPKNRRLDEERAQPFLMISWWYDWLEVRAKGLFLHILALLLFLGAGMKRREREGMVDGFWSLIGWLVFGDFELLGAINGPFLSIW